MAERLDFIVFGATGQTGQYAISYLYKLIKDHGRPLTWGVAGRSEKRLKTALVEIARRLGVADLGYVPIVIADVDDENSIKQMTARARVIINACGPFLLYGEVVVKSCVETGTHHVDISGEKLFIEMMQLKYHKAAEEKGVYIVSGCGFHCLLPDLAVLYLEQNFKGTLNSTEMYVYIYEEGGWTEGCPKLGPSIWLSCVINVARNSEVAVVRKQLFPTSLPVYKPKLYYRLPAHKPKIFDKWAIPFPTTDCDVIDRSQRYFYEKTGKRPIQSTYYIFLESFKYVILGYLYILTFGLVIGILAQFELGRKILLRYPKVFCPNFFDYENASDECLNREVFVFTAVGKGWDEKLSEGHDQYKTPPNKEIIAEFTGRNPGYGFTGVCVAVSGFYLLTESQNLPVRGGVYTTAIAYGKTTMFQHLQQDILKTRIL